MATRFGAIILAAGLSSRMGAREHSPVSENKVLLPWRDGQPIVAHVAAKYLCAGIKSIIVVTGRDAIQVQDALADLDVKCEHNPDFATGEILSSVKVGLRALPDRLESRRHGPVGSLGSVDTDRRHRPVAATFIQPADMPCISQEVIALLMQRHETGWNVAPRHQGRRGHPVLLDRTFWRDMLDLRADARPRDLIQAARLRLVDVEDEGVLLDIDTREAYEQLLKRELRDGGVNLGHDASSLG